MDDLSKISENMEFLKETIVNPYTVDFRVGKYCFEINGPYHYCIDQEGNYIMNGKSQKKKEFLEKIGFIYIEIPFFRFKDINFEMRKAKWKKLF